MPHRISEQFALREIRRLTGLEFFPHFPEAIKELAKALSTAPSEAAAVAFIDNWLRVNTAAPHPADIFSVFPPPEAESMKAAAPACPICGGCGFVIVERRGFSAARSCACRIPNGEPTHENHHTA